MQETQVRFLGKTPWRREWQPTPVFLPGELPGQRSLMGYNSRGHKELDTTERLRHTHQVYHSFSSKEQASFTFMAAVTICSDFGAPQNKVSHCFHFFPICREMMGPDALILGFSMLSFKPAFFTLFFYFYQESLQFLFTFCRQGGAIYISEVIDIFPCNLDSSL